MRFSAALSGSLAEIMQQEIQAAERAVSLGVREATDGLKVELRAQIVSAGLGDKLARTWRAQVYPKGKLSISAAGFVWSKAPNIVRIYEDGATIRSRHGFFLAIPTPAAGRTGDGGKKITPGLWERMHGVRLRLVYRRTGPSLLVADNLRARLGKRGGFAKASASALRTGRNLATVPMFVLVPQVSFRKRLEIAGAARKWIAALPDLVIRNWRETAR